jgi:hypothetical protein
MISPIRNEREVEVPDFETAVIIAVLEESVDYESRKNLDALFATRQTPRTGIYDFREPEEYFSEATFLGGEFVEPVSVLFLIGHLLAQSQQDSESFSVWMSNAHPLISVPNLSGKRFIFGYDLAEKKIAIRSVDIEELIPPVYRPVVLSFKD